jgi:hypothetical protein
MLSLVGVQLVISWVVMRVLEELSQRETMVGLDLQATNPSEANNLARGTKNPVLMGVSPSIPNRG